MMNEPAFIPNTDFKEIECRGCGYKGKPEETGKIDPIHGYALQCPTCKKWYGWGGRKKEIKDANGKREISSIWTAERLGFDFCQLCLRNRNQLGDRETLEVHHIKPIDDGGEDTPKNIWVLCTACHKHVHHMRTYFNLHLQKFFQAYTKADDYEQS